MLHIRHVLLLLSVLILAAFPASCHRTTEEDRVKKVVSEIEEAAEEKEIKTVLGHLSRSYRDPQGHDYDGIKGLLLMYFYRHQRVSVYISGLDVKVSEASAAATFEAVLSGAKDVQSPADLLPEALGVYAFDVSFAREKGEWKVTSAKWERSGAAAP